MESDPAREPTESNRASLPAFQCGQRLFTLAEILQAASELGLLAEFRTRWIEQQVAAARAEAAELEPDPVDVEAVTDAFRYARDLVSAEECDQWLAQRGLTFTDLTASVSRRLRAGLAEEQDPAEVDSGNSWDETLFFIDAVLSDEFSVWGHQLAWRAALAEETRSLPGAGVISANTWLNLEAGFRTACAELVTPGQRQRLLQQQWLNLTFLQLEAAEFDSESAAREAACCIREDGSSLTEVAALNGFPGRSMESFLEDLPENWQKALATACPGEVVSCGSGESGRLLLRLLNRQEPKLDDEPVSARIDALSVSAHFQVLESRHIRWLINPETSA